MGLLDRILMRPEPAKGTRADQTRERYRMAELRLERDTLKDALEAILRADGKRGGGMDPDMLNEATREALKVANWADMRESAREISRENDLP